MHLVNIWVLGLQNWKPRIIKGAFRDWGSGDFSIIWGTLLAPKSALRLSQPWLLLLEVIIFGLAVLALYSLGKTSLAAIFGSIYVINKILMLIWRQ